MNENLIQLVRLLEEYNAHIDIPIVTKFEEPMWHHTSFRVGGIADLFLVPQNREALVSLCGMLNETNARAYFLGNGSNVIFADEGFRGAIVSLSGLKQIDVRSCDIVAEAGASLASVCQTARDASLTGIEFAYGIPGSVGGAVTMNAGAYGGEISFVLKDSTYLDLRTLTTNTITQEEHHYGYRESIYKHEKRVILSATFTLKKGAQDEISAQMSDFMNRRITKQPLTYPSAGSIFKRYPGRYTGQMIEEAGLKGYTIGGAQISEKHAGFIINIGGATCKDILDLIEYVKAVILEKFGCALECEVIVVK